MADIKKALRVALAQRDMSQRDLAKKLKVTEGAVHHWVSTERSMTLRTINVIAKALKLKTSELVALGE
jgi:ribosome-binding protein aMBF1 (putative translation factor)